MLAPPNGDAQIQKELKMQVKTTSGDIQVDRHSNNIRFDFMFADTACTYYYTRKHKHYWAFSIVVLHPKKSSPPQKRLAEEKRSIAQSSRTRLQNRAKTDTGIDLDNYNKAEDIIKFLDNMQGVLQSICALTIDYKTVLDLFRSQE